jgi:hypothetical protein
MSMASILKRLAAIEAKLNITEGKTGNWVIGLSGQLVWDAWDFPEPTEEEAAATRTHLSQRLEATRVRSSAVSMSPPAARISNIKRTHTNTNARN